MAVIPHPPYSHDLAPREFILFKKMELKGRRFDTTESQAESHRVLDTQTGKELPANIPKMKETVASGNYVESDGG
jgi:hypothetical protein